MTEAIRAARFALLSVIERVALLRGEAQWTNGYRTASQSSIAGDHLHVKEKRQWDSVEVAERAIPRVLNTYTRAVRRSMKVKR